MNNGNDGRHPGKWRGFTLDTDHDRARELFKARYGYPPDEVVEAGCILLVGPIGGNGHKATAEVGEVQGEQGDDGRGMLARALDAQREMTPERAREMLAEVEQLAMFEEATT